MSSTVLLKSYLKRLRLPTFSREYGQVARQCGERGQDYEGFLLALAEREVQQRESRAIGRRIKQADFPASKDFAEYDFSRMRSLNKHRLLELSRGSYIREHTNIVFVGDSGLGKTHLAIAMGREACRLGFKVKFFTVAGLANRYAEAREQREVLKLERQIEKYDAIVLDELGYVALGQDCPEHLFNFVSGCYERTSLIVTTNLPFSEWTKVFRDERLTGALLDRFTHRIHIFALEGESHRFLESQRRLQKEPGSCDRSGVVTRAEMVARKEGAGSEGVPQDAVGA